MRQNDSTSLLSLKDYELRAPNAKLLNPALDLELKTGDLLYLRGENGSGKTTLAKVIVDELKRAGVSFEYLPQLSNISSVLPLTLKEVITMLNVELCEIPESLMPSSLLETPWNQASGGERKKTLLIRALLKKPKVVILDEPFNHLDPETIQQMQAWIAELIERRDVLAVVMASHQKTQGNFQGVQVKEVWP